MPRPAFKFDPKTFQEIVDAFRENNWSHASYGHIGRVVGMDKRRISQAWREGAPDKNSTTGQGFPPIKSIAEAEMRGGPRYRAPGLTEDLPVSIHQGGPIAPTPAAPAPAPAAPAPSPAVPTAPVVAPAPVTAASAVPTSAPVTAELVAKPARKVPITQADLAEHAQEALESELRAIAAVRDTAIGAAVSTRRVLGALQGRIDQYAQDLAEKDRQGVPVDGQDLAKQLQRLLIVAEKASQITDQVIKAERLALGSPTEIINMAITTAPTMDAQAEATARSERTLAFLTGRMKARAEQNQARALSEVTEIPAEGTEDLEIESKQPEDDEVDGYTDEVDQEPDTDADV